MAGAAGPPYDISDPGNDFGPGGEPPDDPQATAPPGDTAHGWVKVGAQADGGAGIFTYGNGYFGGDSGAWRQV